MSLIQEALKRKSEELPKFSTPKATDALPETPRLEETKNPKAPPVLILVLILAVCLAIPIGFGIHLIKPRAKAVPPAAKNPAPTAPAAVAVVPAPVAQAPAKPAELLAVTEPVKKEEPAKPVWPALTLTGIAQSDDQRLAILNGKMLSAGRKLGEVTILEVNEQGVVLEFHGERRVLRIDE